LENSQVSAARMMEEEKALSASLEEATRLQVRDEDALKAATEDIERKRVEMQRLFEGKTPEQEEEILQKHINEARRVVASCQGEHETAEGEVNQMRGQALRAAEERQLKQEQLATNQRELDMWVLRFNREHSPMLMEELDAIFNDRTDWKALRAELEAKKNTLQLTALHLDAAQKAVIELQTKNYRPRLEVEMNEAYLSTELGNVRAVLQRQSDDLSALRITLNKHYNCIKDAEQLMADTDHLRQDAEQWSRLSALLGSADGKKFRELAQSYTFGFLVDQANYYLRQLSPRYELRTQPGSLALTVIDHDMFDEERHIQSLSGGETFVASLALALGLASLSSGQVFIGSLFIDEGFGNLDQASLQLVMDALSRLETTQGRKVGVVSHTHQIRQQIHPQIRVVKLPTGGKSRVEVR
jgi:exonuclease SbcC